MSLIKFPFCIHRWKLVRMTWDSKFWRCSLCGDRRRTPRLWNSL